jgi:hypothetical protein
MSMNLRAGGSLPARLIWRSPRWHARAAISSNFSISRLYKRAAQIKRPREGVSHPRFDFDSSGKTYELQFESDGSPNTVRRLRQSPLIPENRRARQTERRECRQKADIAKVLPRDWPAYINQCLAEVSEKLASDAPQ